MTRCMCLGGHGRRTANQYAQYGRYTLTLPCTAHVLCGSCQDETLAGMNIWRGLSRSSGDRARCMCVPLATAYGIGSPRKSGMPRRDQRNELRASRAQSRCTHWGRVPQRSYCHGEDRWHRHRWRTIARIPTGFLLLSFHRTVSEEERKRLRTAGDCITRKGIANFEQTILSRGVSRSGMLEDPCWDA